MGFIYIKFYFNKIFLTFVSVMLLNSTLFLTKITTFKKHRLKLQENSIIYFQAKVNC